MEDQDIRAVILTTLQAIAPEVAPEELDPARPLRDQVDLDSMDFLNFVIGLHKKLNVDIPEADYARLSSVDAIVAYLQTRLGSQWRA